MNHGIRARQTDYVCWCEVFHDGGTLRAMPVHVGCFFAGFLVHEKSLLLTNDAACRGSSLTRLGPGHLMVSGDFCLSLSNLGATVSVLEEKTVSFRLWRCEEGDEALAK